MLELATAKLVSTKSAFLVAPIIFGVVLKIASSWSYPLPTGKSRARSMPIARGFCCLILSNNLASRASSMGHLY